jgi:hypothetical protein
VPTLTTGWLHHDGKESGLRSWSRTAADGIGVGCLGGSSNLPGVSDLVVIVDGEVHLPVGHDAVSRCDTRVEGCHRGRKHGSGY